MSFTAQAFRIAIASPSDVEEERAMVVRAIQEWNDLHSAERKAVLLPLHWESHTSPGLGERPQDTINREVVDRADLLVGIFWTRLGSPTGDHKSGTLEEIDRAGAAGKPVMLYFSRAKIDPNEIDVKQLEALRTYRDATYPQGLVETYSSPIEFRDKFSRQLEMKVRKLLVADAASGIESDGGAPHPVIEVEFVDPSSGDPLGPELSLSTEIVDYDPKSLPDFGDSSREKNTGGFPVSFNLQNKEYFREYARFEVFRRAVWPLQLLVRNSGKVGARDVFLEILVSEGEERIGFFPESRVPKRPAKEGVLPFTSAGFEHDSASVEHKDGEWRISYDVGVVQPGRSLKCDNIVYLAPFTSGEIAMTVLIYADTLPAPVRHELKIKADVRRIAMPANELVPELAGNKT